MKEWLVKMMIFVGSLCFAGIYAQPQISVSADSIIIAAPRFTPGFHELLITNTGNQMLNIEITDEPVGSALQFFPKPNRKSDYRHCLHQLKDQIKTIQISDRERYSSMEMPPTNSLTVVMIEDSTGDVGQAGLDITSVSYAEDFFSYTFTIEYAAAPDTQQIVILSVDTDQNLATGNFPAPFGFAPVFFDIGSEYEILFDVGGFLTDSLGLPPSAIAIAAGDTTLMPVGFGILTTSGNSISATFIKALSPDLMLDNDMYAGCIVFTTDTTNLTLPDFAPNFGHGGVGAELGVSWLAQSDTAGFSEIPFTAQIAPGESFPLINIFAAAYPEGIYRASLQINNNSSNQPNLTIPVKARVENLGSAIISVEPTAIEDTLSINDPPVAWTLNVYNHGDAVLLGAIVDSLESGEGWLSLPLSIFAVEPGDSFSVSVVLDAAGLTPGITYHATLRVVSNAANFPEMEIPVSLTVTGPTGIETENMLPQRFALYDNYPNPFNPSTTIAFDVPHAANVNITVYNLVGQTVRELKNGFLSAGRYKLVWDGRDSSGQVVGSGIYLVEMVADGFRSVKKMVLLK